MATATEILARIAAPADSSLPKPRVLLVFAHPDDEVIAIGARLERMSVAHLLTLTDGAPADGADARAHGFANLAAYREARQHELTNAVHAAGLPASLASTPAPPPIPVPDQQAMQHLEALTHAVLRVIEEVAPEAVLTHPYEGGHPDHDACAFAVHAACQLLAASDESEQVSPWIVEAPSYHADEQGRMVTGSFLHPSPLPSVLCRLSAEEQARKKALFACFTSQADVLANFGVEQELFRIAPQYDFAQPPHPGAALYESFGWGLTPAQFCRNAADAQLALFPPGLQEGTKPLRSRVPAPTCSVPVHG